MILGEVTQRLTTLRPRWGCCAPHTPKPKPKTKEPTVPKVIRKTLRFSDSEWLAIESKLQKNGLDFSEFARASILKKEVESKADLDAVRLLAGQFSRLGNNLNQIARGVNKKEIGAVEVLRQLVEIEKQIKGIVDGTQISR